MDTLTINQRLPAELLEKLYLLLQPSDQLSLAMVCKTWYMVYCQSTAIHKSKAVRLRAPISNRTLMHQCLPQHSVSRLELIGISIVGNRRFLNEFVQEGMLRDVRELALLDCHMSRMQLAAIVAACPSLTLLHLANMDCLFTPPATCYRYRGGFKPEPFTDEELVRMSPSLHSVRCLKLERFTDISDPIFHHLTDLMPNLDSLHLTNVSMRHSTDVTKYFTFSSLARFVILRAAQIKELYLDSIALQAGSIAVLLRTNQLRLNKLGLRLDTDPFFDAVRLQPELECLELCVSRAMDSRTLLPFVERLSQLHLEQCQVNSSFLHVFTQMNRLSSLRLVNVRVNNVNFDGATPFEIITNVVSNLRELRELSLVNVGECRVENIVEMFCNLPRLQRVELEGCAEMASDAFTLLLSLRPRLTHFTLHSCSIGDAQRQQRSGHAAATPPVHMPALEKLHLVNCQLTDDVYLKFEHLPSLRSFQVACHPHSIGKGLCHLAKIAAGLEVLHISQMMRISDTYERQKSLSIILSSLPRLRDVGLLLFGSISDDLLNWLLACCPRLHSLDIRGCTCNKLIINKVLKMKLANIKLA